MKLRLRDDRSGVEISVVRTQASGDRPGAFDAIKQLKVYPEVLRARVADKHRLLFCLMPDRVRVVDLIRRADLDRRIERLQASGLPPIR